MHASQLVEPRAEEPVALVAEDVVGGYLLGLVGQHAAPREPTLRAGVAQWLERIDTSWGYQLGELGVGEVNHVSAVADPFEEFP